MLSSFFAATLIMLASARQPSNAPRTITNPTCPARPQWSQFQTGSWTLNGTCGQFKKCLAKVERLSTRVCQIACNGQTCVGLPSKREVGYVPCCGQPSDEGLWSPLDYGAWQNSGVCGQFQANLQEQQRIGSRLCLTTSDQTCTGETQITQQRYVICQKN